MNLGTEDWQDKRKKSQTLTGQFKEICAMPHTCDIDVHLLLRV